MRHAVFVVGVACCVAAGAVAIPSVTRAAPTGCAVVAQVRTNLTDLQKVVAATPHLSQRQIKQRTDAVKFRELNLELSNHRAVVPRGVEGAMTQVISLVRAAGMHRDQGKAARYRADLARARIQMTHAWSGFTAFRTRARCP